MDSMCRAESVYVRSEIESNVSGNVTEFPDCLVLHATRANAQTKIPAIKGLFIFRINYIY